MYPMVPIIIFLYLGGNILILQLWGEDNEPWMQALHFIFGVGALIAPLIVGQFLLDNTDLQSQVSNEKQCWWALSKMDRLTVYR